MSSQAAEAEPPPAGWGPALVKHFLESRDWGPVHRFYGALIAGEAGLDSLGIELEAAVPPASAARPGTLSHRPAPGRQPVPVQQRQQDQAPLPQARQDAAQAQPGDDVPAGTAAAAGGAARSGARSWGRLQRATFKVLCAYHGPAFCGWQGGAQQDGGKGVEQVAQAALRQLLQRRAAAAGGSASTAALKPPAAAAASGACSRQEKEDGGALAVEAGCCWRNGGCRQGDGGRGPAVTLGVAGRTDRGVHALGQAFSFFTWDTELAPEDVLSALNGARPGQLRAWHAAPQPRSFHASFSAQWRRYLYLLPLRQPGGSAASTAREGEGAASGQQAATLSDEEAVAVEAAGDVDVELFAALLASLEGRLLDYTAFARDTPPGKDTRRRLLRARAWRATLPCPDKTPVLAVDLVGGRFLRRMVRVLVATAAREATPAAARFAGPCSHQPPLPTTRAPPACGCPVSAAGEGGFLPCGPEPARAAAQGRSSAQEQASCGEAGGGEEGQQEAAAALLRVAASMDRRASAPAAPAGGLCFLEAGYAPWPSSS